MNYVDRKQLERLHKAILERLLIPNTPPMASNKDTFTQRHWSVLNADAHYIALYILSNTDFTEVVRCKDCKFNKIMDDGETYACIRQTAYRKPTDFCSYGERKETK